MVTQDEGTASTLVVLTASFLAVAVLLVFLRFWARFNTAAKYGADDWLVVVGLAFSFVTGALNFSMIQLGSGQSEDSLTTAASETIFKTLMAFECMYTTAEAIIKISILYLYLRIFPSRRFRTATYVVGGSIVAWWFALILVSIFQCRPVSLFWTQNGQGGSCLGTKTAFCMNAIPSVIQSFVVLLMPVEQIWGLHATKTQKLRLLTTFGLGGFVLLASIYRFWPIMQYSSDDGIRTIALACSSSVVELAAGVISACLPTLRPLVRKASDRVNKTVKSRALTGSPQPDLMGKSRSQPDGGSTQHARDPFERLGTSYSENCSVYPRDDPTPSPRHSNIPLERMGSTNFSRKSARQSRTATEKELFVQVETKITVSIERMETGREEVCPWETVVISGGKAS